MSKIKIFLQKTLKILNFAKPLWHYYLMTSILALVMNMIGLVQPWLMKFFLDDVLTNKKTDLFPLMIVAFIGSYILAALLGILNGLINTKLSPQDFLLSTQHSALSTQHSALSTFFSSSLIPKRHHRVDAGRAASWEKSGNRCDGDQQQC